MHPRTDWELIEKRLPHTSSAVLLNELPNNGDRHHILCYSALMTKYTHTSWGDTMLKASTIARFGAGPTTATFFPASACQGANGHKTAVISAQLIAACYHISFVKFLLQ